jgi:Plant transposon protein
MFLLAYLRRTKICMVFAKVVLFTPTRFRTKPHYQFPRARECAGNSSEATAHFPPILKRYGESNRTNTTEPKGLVIDLYITGVGHQRRQRTPQLSLKTLTVQVLCGMSYNYGPFAPYIPGAPGAGHSDMGFMNEIQSCNMVHWTFSLVMFSAQLVKCARLRRQRNTSTRAAWGGSRAGKRGNRKIGREDAAQKLHSAYFFRMPCHAGLTPIFNVNEFERKYLVPLKVYETILEGLLAWKDPHFTQHRDRCGALGASTDKKVWSAMRQLAYGVPADATVECGRVAESMSPEAFKKFSEGIVRQFESEWLRLPTMGEAQEIERQYRSLGFPGCLGCLDCASWQWDMCPIGW